MKKKKIGFLLGLLLILVLPNYVNAASLSLGSGTENSNITKIPVILNLNDGEKVDRVTFDCSTDNDNVSCKIEANTDLVAQAKNTYIVAAGTSFSNGDCIGHVVLTNDTTSKRSDVEVELINAKIGDTSITVPTKKYDVNAYVKPKELSSDASLSKLTVSQGKMNIEFSKDVFEYVVYGIADTINSVKFDWECTNCTVSITGGASVTAKIVKLNQGENIVKLTVTSEDYSKNQTYQVKVIKGETTYNSAYLKEMEIIGYKLSPEFKKDTFAYQIVVPYKVKNLFSDIKYTTEDSSAPTPELTGGDDLIVGSNNISIAVTNQIGDVTNVYTIEVVRLGENDVKITKYINGEVTFTNSKGEENTLSEEDFKVQYPDEWAKVENKDYQFDEDGNVIIEDKTKKDENTTKTEEKDSKVLVILIIIVVALLIIGVSAYFIFFKKKGKKNNKKDDDNKSEKAKEDVVKLEKEETEEKSEPEEKENEIDETGIEEDLIKEENKTKRTVSVDEALEDLMNTKQYKFEDKD